jgi:hypothetical protein
MKSQEVNKLPFWKTIGRSFKYVFKNKSLIKGVLPVIGILIITQILMGLPYLCSIKADACVVDWRQKVTLITVVVAAIGIIINYCRSIICKADVDFKSGKFWKQMGLYLLSSLVLSLVVLAPSFICILLSVFLFNMVGLPNLATVSSILLPLIFCVLFAPLFLVFPSIAAEDYKMLSWKKLFSLVKGNHNAVFWAQFIIMMPYWILFRATVELYNLIGVDHYIVNLIFVTIGLVLGVMDACFKGAFFAHIYQFFKINDNK